MWRLLLHRFERSERLVHEMVNGEPNDGAEDEDNDQTDAQINERRFLVPFDGGNDRRAAMWIHTSEHRADLPMAFVA